MNEGFQIQLTKQGAPWPVDSLSAEGIVLNGESDAFPRALRLEFDARSPVTALQMNRVRQLRGWQPLEFNLHAAALNGTIQFTGYDPHSLPSGNYWIRCEISDLKLPATQKSVDIAANQSTFRVDLSATQDPRTVTLTTAFAEFDPAILSVLQAPASTFDGLATDAWLASPNPRPSRKACLLNVLAKLRTVPSPQHPLIAHVSRLFFAGTERVYGVVAPALISTLQALSASDGNQEFMYEGSPTSPTHQKILARVEQQGWGQASDYDLHSFRQFGKFSLQAVVAVPRTAGRPHYADFDIDLGNPLQDVQGFLIHMGELAGGKATDHLALRDKLKGSTKEFLYYRVS
jgi:hypothetical protein